MKAAHVVHVDFRASNTDMKLSSRMTRSVRDI